MPGTQKRTATEHETRRAETDVIGKDGPHPSSSTMAGAANAATSTLNNGRFPSLFLPRAKRAHFRVRINIVELANVPLVNGKLYLTWKFKGSHDSTWVPKPLTPVERGKQRTGTVDSKGSGEPGSGSGHTQGRQVEEDDDDAHSQDQGSEILVEEPQRIEASEPSSAGSSSGSHSNLKPSNSFHAHHARTESGFSSISSSRFASQTSLALPSESPRSATFSDHGRPYTETHESQHNKDGGQSARQGQHRVYEAASMQDERARSHPALSNGGRDHEHAQTDSHVFKEPRTPSKVLPAKARIQGLFSPRKPSTSSFVSTSSSVSRSSTDSGMDGHLALNKMHSRSSPQLTHEESLFEQSRGHHVHTKGGSIISTRHSSFTSRFFNIRSGSSSRTLTPEKQNATCDDLRLLDDEAYEKLMHGPATGGKGRTPHRGISSSGVQWRYVIENKVMIPISNKGALLPFELRMHVYHEIKPEHAKNGHHEANDRSPTQNGSRDKSLQQHSSQDTDKSSTIVGGDQKQTKTKTVGLIDETQVNLIGSLRLDLAAYAGKEAEDLGVRERGMTRRYLLQESKINSMLKLSIRVEQLDGPTDYAAPSLPKQHLFGSLKDFITERPNWLNFDSGMEKHLRKLEAKRDKMYGTELGLLNSNTSASTAVNRSRETLANARSQMKEGRLVLSGPDRIEEEQKAKWSSLDAKPRSQETSGVRSSQPDDERNEASTDDGYGRHGMPDDGRDRFTDSRSPSGGGASVASRKTRTDHTRNSSFSPYAPLSTTSGEHRQYFHNLNSGKDRDRGKGGTRRDGGGAGVRTADEVIEELFNAPNETYLERALGNYGLLTDGLRRKDKGDEQPHERSTTGPDQIGAKAPKSSIASPEQMKQVVMTGNEAYEKGPVHVAADSGKESNDSKSAEDSDEHYTTARHFSERRKAMFKPSDQPTIEEDDEEVRANNKE